MARLRHYRSTRRRSVAAPHAAPKETCERPYPDTCDESSAGPVAVPPGIRVGEDWYSAIGSKPSPHARARRDALRGAQQTFRTRRSWREFHAFRELQDA